MPIDISKGEKNQSYRSNHHLERSSSCCGDQHHSDVCYPVFVSVKPPFRIVPDFGRGEADERKAAFGMVAREAEWPIIGRILLKNSLAGGEAC